MLGWNFKTPIHVNTGMTTDEYHSVITIEINVHNEHKKYEYASDLYRVLTGFMIQQYAALNSEDCLVMQQRAERELTDLFDKYVTKRLNQSTARKDKVNGMSTLL